MYNLIKNMIMKKKIILLVTFMLLAMSTKAQEYNFRDYFFPFGFRTYVNPLAPESEGKIGSMSQYSFQSGWLGDFLIEETYIGVGIMSSKVIYNYKTDGNAVISTVQIRQNSLTGSRSCHDLLAIFAFPVKNVPFEWTETVNGEKFQCKSEYVYINASIDRNSFFKKAVKITRDNSYVYKYKKHRIIETSYWVCNYGRVITFTDWDGTKHTSSKLNVLDYIQEVSKEEFDAYTKKHP